MKVKNIFNILLFSFLLIVPLVSVKIKIKFIPVSSDFIIGFFLILTGIIYCAIRYRKERESFKLLKDKNIYVIVASGVLFSLLSIVSCLYAKSKTAAFNETLRFMEYLMIFILAYIAADKDTVKRSFILFYAGMIIASLLGVFQYVFNLSEYTAEGFFGRGRIYSTFVNPNYWGAAINLVIYYPIIEMIESKGKKRILNIAAFVLFFFNLIFSSTRGSWLGFAAGLFVIFVLKYRKKIKYLAIAFILGMFVPFVRKRVLSVFDMNSLTNHERLKLWKTGLLMFKEHKLFGLGSGNYDAYYHDYIMKHRDLYLGRNHFTVHNSYLRVLAELGIIGMLFFTIVYAALVKITYDVYKSHGKCANIALAMIGFWAAYLFQNFFNNLMFIPQLAVLPWIMTALLYKSLYMQNTGGY